MAERGLHRDVVEPAAAVLGRRIRAARRTAGLTQADLAGNRVSVAYISRIEAGQRRPSRRLLAAIADKLGVTVDELTETAGDPHSDLRVRLGIAEQRLLQGVPGEAFALASAIVIEADAVGLRALGDHATYVCASARHSQSSFTEAVEILGSRYGEGAQTGSSVRVLTLLTHCHLALGHVNEALEVAELGTQLVEGYELRGLPEALVHAAAHSRALLCANQPERAADLCRSAVLASSRMKKPGDLANAYRSASALEAEAGAVTQAAVHFDLAQAARQIELYETYLAPLREQLSTQSIPEPA